MASFDRDVYHSLLMASFLQIGNDYNNSPSIDRYRHCGMRIPVIFFLCLMISQFSLFDMHNFGAMLPDIPLQKGTISMADVFIAYFCLISSALICGDDY